MLDPDISTEDAKYLLSAPQLDDEPTGPLGWSRRTFLQAVGMGVFGGAAVGSLGQGFFGTEIPEAWAGTPIGPNDGILVVIVLYGGNDGLNTVVPYTDSTYYSIRSNIAIPAASVLPLDGSVGLNPELGYLKSLYDAGQMAVVQGVGYGGPDLSHFTSMGIWMNGRFGGGSSSGWIGRWLDGQPAATADLAAASIDTSVPLHMVGTVRRAVAVTPGDLFGTSTKNEDKRMYSGIRGMSSASAGRGQWHDAFATTMTRQLDVAADVAPAFSGTLPSGGLNKRLGIAARLINANIGLRVLDVGLDGFDNHENQPNRHTSLLRDLNTAVQTFYTTLAPEYRNRVTLMTMSEFGRTPGSNGSSGTDHGTAAPLFVIGQNVRGGLYGAAPSLTSLDKNKRLLANVDFRAVYGSVLDGWLGGGGSTIVNGAFPDLHLFNSGPGSASLNPQGPIAITSATLPAEPAGFVPMSPQRVFDTRDGTGGRVGALNAGEEWTFPFAGQYGIPTGTVAVALNLTSVEASEPTFVTAWPTGATRPFTANLNPVPGMAVPNLVVGRLGSGGALDLFNNTGAVHLIGDLVGYFAPTSNVGLMPLTPARLLDTRDGTGAASPGPIGQGQTIDLQVADRGGVPANVAAVALNVTVTEPTTGSFLTVFPAGEARPLAASVNMVAGQTVPNMVLARVRNGQVSIYNNTGSTHVVADVLGCFADGAPGKYVAMTPVRVLDTREGIGALKARVAQDAVSLALTGVGGIPASGVSAVLLNVTAVSPSANTFITVYPTGGDRPLAANLNAVAGQIVPNMVIGRLGPDGRVVIFNFAGDVDLVADVMGYFK